ncbi:MAG: hypothetical protein IKT34_00870 [Clostridia bacterium]|nr:hypothetical protein [Clostridia bacterium]
MANTVKVYNVLGIGRNNEARFQKINESSNTYAFDVDLKDAGAVTILLDASEASDDMTLVCCSNHENVKDEEIAIPCGIVNVIRLDTYPIKKNDGFASFKLTSVSPIGDLSPKIMILSYKNVVNN